MAELCSRVPERVDVEFQVPMALLLEEIREKTSTVPSEEVSKAASVLETPKAEDESKRMRRARQHRAADVSTSIKSKGTSTPSGEWNRSSNDDVNYSVRMPHHFLLCRISDYHSSHALYLY
jgi:hypothetical protein